MSELVICDLCGENLMFSWESSNLELSMAAASMHYSNPVVQICPTCLRKIILHMKAHDKNGGFYAVDEEKLDSWKPAMGITYIEDDKKKEEPTTPDKETDTKEKE